jgi:hypothetical protein
MASQRSLINKDNKRGPKIDPCGTPLRTGKYPFRKNVLEASRKIRLNEGYSRALETVNSLQFQTEKGMIHCVKRFRKIKQHQSNKKSLAVGNIKKCSDSAVAISKTRLERS